MSTVFCYDAKWGSYGAAKFDYGYTLNKPQTAYNTYFNGTFKDVYGVYGGIRYQMITKASQDYNKTAGIEDACLEAIIIAGLANETSDKAASDKWYFLQKDGTKLQWNAKYAKSYSQQSFNYIPQLNDLKMIRYYGNVPSSYRNFAKTGINDDICKKFCEEKCLYSELHPLAKDLKISPIMGVYDKSPSGLKYNYRVRFEQGDLSLTSNVVNYVTEHKRRQPWAA